MMIERLGALEMDEHRLRPRKGARTPGIGRNPAAELRLLFLAESSIVDPHRPEGGGIINL